MLLNYNSETRYTHFHSPIKTFSDKIYRDPFLNDVTIIPTEYSCKSNP